MVTTRKPDDAEVLRRLFDALAESSASLPGSEVLAEAREAGENPEAIAAGMRGVALDAVKALRQERLRAARRAYELERAKLAAHRSGLPATAEARRRLLEAALKAQPELRAVTLAARDLRGLPDSDVESLLHQLDALGALPDSGGEGDP
jgi:hypothetical protein